MDKYKRLVSNTLLFAISTFSSKILSFFLTAYRTRVMGTADYGGMDAIVTIGNFFIPLVSLGIANAIIRFGLEKNLRDAVKRFANQFVVRRASTCRISESIVTVVYRIEHESYLLGVSLVGQQD